MRWLAVVSPALLFCLATARGQDDPAARTATLDPADLRDFDAQPPAVQRLLTEALRLTKLSLSYRYGSSDPAAGGMDCSGTIYHLLQGAGLTDTPRDSSEMYRWVWLSGRFQAVVSSSPIPSSWRDSSPATCFSGRAPTMSRAIRR